MWNVLGDYDFLSKKNKVLGTYYWHPNDLEKFHWNLIDGALISPSIMDNIIIESVTILSKPNGKDLVKTVITSVKESLLTSGFSDHLPVKFIIKTN